MLTARKIAQIGTFPRRWCGTGPAGAIAGAAVPYLGRRRRRIGFSSRYTTNGRRGDPPTVVVGWLGRVALRWRSARLLAGKRNGAPFRRGRHVCYACSRRMQHMSCSFFISSLAHPPYHFYSRFFSSTNKQHRRTPCLRQHCRCQRCRQDHPGHWCRCRRSGEFHRRGRGWSKLFWVGMIRRTNGTHTAQPHTVGEFCGCRCCVGCGSQHSVRWPSLSKPHTGVGSTFQVVGERSAAECVTAAVFPR